MEHNIRVKDRDVMDNVIKYPCVCRHKNTGSIFVFMDEENGIILPSEASKYKGENQRVFTRGWRANENSLERLRNVKLTLEF